MMKILYSLPSVPGRVFAPREEGLILSAPLNEGPGLLSCPLNENYNEITVDRFNAQYRLFYTPMCLSSQTNREQQGVWEDNVTRFGRRQVL